MKDLPLNPDKELFKWGPVPGRAYLNSDFVDQMYPSMPAPYEAYAFPKALFLFKGERMIWVNEFDEVRERGKAAFRDIFMDEAEAKNFRASWDAHIKALTDREAKLSAEYLAGLADAAFTKEWKEFYQLLSNFWVPGIVIELANYASDEALREMLRPYIKDDNEIDLALSTLAAAEEMTFYQMEELDLAESDDIAAHQAKYFWIHNSYSRVEVMPASFFEERKKEFPRELRKEFEHQLAAAKEAKAALQKKHGLPDELMKTADALWRTLIWQDERKMHIIKYLHYKKLFLEEAAKRLKVPYDDLLTITSKRAPGLLEDPSLLETARRRKGLYGFWLSEEEGEVELDRETAGKYWDIYAEPPAEKSLREFSGMVVSKGSQAVVRGIARIRLDAYKADGFAAGEILVAPMTSPEYIFLMKQAAAIVTDTGGLTSHAAVVSREMNKLCVANTKIATSILKDGDMIEIDAATGVVKLLT